MRRNFNEKLNRLLRDFYNSTGRRIALFDKDGSPLTEYPKERSSFCTTVRNEGGGAKCNECDHYGFALAKEKGSSVYRCHAGLLEVCTPIEENGTVVGYLMFGQMRYKAKQKEQYLFAKENARRYFKSDYLFESAFRDIGRIDETCLNSLISIINTCVGYIQLEELVDIRQKGLWGRINDYINTNYSHPFTLTDMAGDLSVSIPTLCKCAKDNSNKTVITLLTERRLERAKHYLANTNLSVCEISDKVGITDYNYFSRIFKAKNGTSPSFWRKEHADK